MDRATPSWVSFERPEDGEPRELRAKADFTDVTAEENPDWRIDLNDDVDRALASGRRTRRRRRVTGS